jgi:hypothetical protein
MASVAPSPPLPPGPPPSQWGSPSTPALGSYKAPPVRMRPQHSPAVACCGGRQVSGVGPAERGLAGRWQAARAAFAMQTVVPSTQLRVRLSTKFGRAISHASSSPFSALQYPVGRFSLSDCCCCSLQVRIEAGLAATSPFARSPFNTARADGVTPAPETAPVRFLLFSPNSKLIDWQQQLAAAGCAQQQLMERVDARVAEGAASLLPPARNHHPSSPPPRAALHPAAVSCAPCATLQTHPAKHHGKQRAVWCVPLSQPPNQSLRGYPRSCSVHDAPCTRRGSYISEDGQVIDIASSGGFVINPLFVAWALRSLTHYMRLLYRRRYLLLLPVTIVAEKHDVGGRETVVRPSFRGIFGSAGVC